MDYIVPPMVKGEVLGLTLFCFYDPVFIPELIFLTFCFVFIYYDTLYIYYGDLSAALGIGFGTGKVGSKFLKQVDRMNTLHRLSRIQVPFSITGNRSAASNLCNA